MSCRSALGVVDRKIYRYIHLYIYIYVYTRYLTKEVVCAIFVVGAVALTSLCVKQNSREFFLRIFWSCRVFCKTNVYELNFATFSAICTFEILLNALVNFEKSKAKSIIL